MSTCHKELPQSSAMAVSVASANDFTRICDGAMTNEDVLTHLSMSPQYGSKVPLLATMVTTLAT